MNEAPAFGPDSRIDRGLGCIHSSTGCEDCWNKQRIAALDAQDGRPGKNRTIESLRRRLEKWELVHLRALAADLSERLERAENEMNYANDIAEFWRENAMELQRSLYDEGMTVGITKDGQIGVVALSEQTQAAPNAGHQAQSGRTQRASECLPLVEAGNERPSGSFPTGTLPASVSTVTAAA